MVGTKVDGTKGIDSATTGGEIAEDPMGDEETGTEIIPPPTLTGMTVAVGGVLLDWGGGRGGGCGKVAVNALPSGSVEFIASADGFI